MIQRIDWDEYFMDIATQVSRRCTCTRRIVGAVLVRDKHILATGYNGSASGEVHCSDVGCRREQLGYGHGEGAHVCRGVHAEQNALIQCAIHGILTPGSTLYCTAKPCFICAKMLVNARVSRIVCIEGREDKYTDELFESVGMQIEYYKK